MYVRNRLRSAASLPDQVLIRIDGFDKLQEHLHDYPGVGQHPDRGPSFYLDRMLGQRKVHFFNGLSDKGTGDDRPPAMAQGMSDLLSLRPEGHISTITHCIFSTGANRVERGRNYYAHLERMQNRSGQRPDPHMASWTVDWVPNVGHDGMAM